MRYTRIDVVGDRPGRHAVMTRKRDSGVIEVEVLTPEHTHVHRVAADSRSDQWALAERVQAILDGRRGAGGDIRSYFNAIQMLGDC